MEGLVALILDGSGGARRLDREALRRWTPPDGALWVQVDPQLDEGREWLVDEAGLPEGDRDTLLRPVRQTRVEVVEGGGCMFSMRLHDGETGDTREARALARADRVVTVSSDRFPALEACATRLARGQGPGSVSELIQTALHVATESDEISALKLDEQVTDLEARAERNLKTTFDELREARTRGTALRRRLGSEREALVQLRQNGPPWLLVSHPDMWRDTVAHCIELIEEVDAIIDRLRALQDYAQNRLSNVLGDRLYLLTILSAIMMPLSFVTGLLGVNIGGIPAAHSRWAFTALCLLLVAVALGEYVLLRRLRWVPGEVPTDTETRAGPRQPR
jgi:zinc transporter